MTLRASLMRSAARKRVPTGNPSHLLLHGDGQNNGAEIVDSSTYARTISRTGVVTSTAQSKFGGASLLFSGTSQHLTAPSSDDWHIGNGDFTVEAWVYLTGSPITEHRPIAVHDNINVTRGWLFLCDKDNGGRLNFTLWTSNSTFVRALSPSAPALNQWLHVAAARAGNTLRLFIDGVVVATTDITGATAQNPSQPLAIGTLWLNGAPIATTTWRWQGHMDELRITKGFARYTGNFTPPDAAFTE